MVFSSATAETFLGNEDRLPREALAYLFLKVSSDNLGTEYHPTS